MLKNLGAMGNLLKQAQDLQSKVQQLREEAEKLTVEGSAGGGMVTTVVNGKLQLVSVRIDPGVFAGGDREMIEDLFLAAANDGIRKAQRLMSEEMTKAAGGIKIPGLTP